MEDYSRRIFCLLGHYGTKYINISVVFFDSRPFCPGLSYVQYLLVDRDDRFTCLSVLRNRLLSQGGHTYLPSLYIVTARARVSALM